MYDNVAFVNCGVSGCTTVDYLPAMNTLFPKMLTALASMDAKEADMVFSIMLGTNDSAIKGPTGSPVLPQQYRTNFKDNYLSDLIAEQGNAGTFYLHPNAKGADVLATFWLNAINRVLTSKK